MKIEDFEALVNCWHRDRLCVMFKRGYDYATEDILSNFKRLSAICTIWKLDITKPCDCAFFLLLLKIDRIRNLLSSQKEPKGERLEDSFRDAQNYLDLIRALIEEE